MSRVQIGIGKKDKCGILILSVLSEIDFKRMEMIILVGTKGSREKNLEMQKKIKNQKMCFFVSDFLACVTFLIIN